MRQQGKTHRFRAECLACGRLGQKPLFTQARMAAAIASMLV